MYCLVVKVYCSLSHHLSQPSPLFLCMFFDWDCFMCCCFLQLTDDDAMSVTLWLMCLVRVRQHVQLYSAAGIFEITPPPPNPGPILSHWRAQYMYHVTSWSPNTVQQIQEMKGLRFDWRTLASFQNAPTVGLNIPIQQEYW